jgi:hypothetical protein
MLHAIIIFVLMLGGSIGVAFFGTNRKFGFWGYFFASMLLTPLIGILLVISSDDPAKKESPKSPTQQ